MSRNQEFYTGTQRVDGWVRTSALVPFQGNNLRYHDINDLATSLRGGFREPLHFAYNYVSGLGALVEGNHRVQAALHAGIEHVPVQLRVHEHARGVHPVNKQPGYPDAYPHNPAEVPVLRSIPSLRHIFAPEDLR